MNSRKLYNREKKVIGRKSFDINSMLGNLVQDTKYKILSKALDTTINEAKEELAYTDVEERFEGKVCHDFIDYLIQKKNDSKSFYKLISRSFSDNINNEDFSRWLSRKLGIQHHLFVSRLLKWTLSSFQETRGRKAAPLDTRQTIYDEWLSNTIPCVLNGCETVKLRKSNYLKRYSGIVNNPPLTETTNKCKVTFYEATRGIITCTVKELQYKLLTKHGINVSTGTLLDNKPFFLSYANEKERVTSMCSQCINIHLLFNSLKQTAEKNSIKSVSEYFMNGCSCSKTENGFWSFKCWAGNCKNCKKIKPAKYTCKNIQNKNALIKFYLYEVTKKSYVSLKDQKNTISVKTERVYHEETFSSIVERLNKVKIHCLSHRFQVLNEKFEWPRITSTADDLGEIFWMDYSENLTGTPKDQPQAAFFNKEQFSLHCTVGIKRKDEKVDYSYHYHFSDNNTHDSVFTHYVINDLLCNSNLEALQILHFKSDNCRSQYKCKYVFPRYQGIARNNNKTVITYYGVEGHGKGLVDAMSSFGVKNPCAKQPKIFLSIVLHKSKNTSLQTIMIQHVCMFY